MLRRLATACLIVLATLSIGRTATADVTFVWLKDGRLLAGDIDPRTNDERLWLRSSGTGFVLATSVAWDNIEAAHADGKHLKPMALKERSASLRSESVVPPTPAAAEPRDTLMHLPRPSVRRDSASRVQSLDVQARVANWDRDAEDDGVEVRVYPRNVHGNVVPVAGQLTVELVARNQLPLQDADAFPRLGRWSLSVAKNDFHTEGAVYRLPYRSARHAKDLTLQLHGLVKATLHVHGHGRFEAEAAAYLKSFNPVRDDLQRERYLRAR